MSGTKSKTGMRKVARETDEVGFAVGDHVVYPTHGVGRITGIDTQEIVGQKLRLRPVKVANDLGDRDQVARINLGLVFLGAAAPHRPLDAGASAHRLKRLLDRLRPGELAHSDGGGLRDRHAQRHLVLLERDHEELKRHTRYDLLLDIDDLADTVGGVDDALAGPKPVTLHCLFRGHTPNTPDF